MPSVNKLDEVKVVIRMNKKGNPRDAAVGTPFLSRFFEPLKKFWQL